MSLLIAKLRLLAFQKFNLTEQELIFCRDFSKQPNHASVALPMRNLILMMLRSLLTSLRTQSRNENPDHRAPPSSNRLAANPTRPSDLFSVRRIGWLWVWLSDFGPAGVPP